MADPFADAADYFGDDAAPTPPLSPRPALFPAPSAEEVAEAKARKEAAATPPESWPRPPRARARRSEDGAQTTLPLGRKTRCHHELATRSRNTAHPFLPCASGVRL